MSNLLYNIDVKFTINKSYHTAIHSLRVLLSQLQSNEALFTIQM